MTLNEFISNLITLQAQGHGELPVYSSHGCSGVIEALSYAHVEEVEDEDYGPYGLEIGKKYISIYTGK